MSRTRVWTGSRWSDVAIWTGSQWKYYVDDVYGAGVYSYDMNGGANGWVQEYGAGGETTALNWSNIHIYANDYTDNAYGTSQYLRLNTSIGGIYLKPGTIVHAQASMLVQHLASEGAGTGANVGISADFGTEWGAPGCYMSKAVPYGPYGWAVLDTRYDGGTGYTVPENGGNPYLMPNLTTLEMWHNGATGALGPYNTYRMFCDWFQLIDQNGNLLMKLTANRIPNMSVWNGSAWV